VKLGLSMLTREFFLKKRTEEEPVDIF